MGIPFEHDEPATFDVDPGPTQPSIHLHLDQNQDTNKVYVQFWQFAALVALSALGITETILRIIGFGS